MLVGGLGIQEIIVILIVLLLAFGLPVALIVALVLFINSRNRKSKASLKKCTFCAYTIPIEATVCRFCGRELRQ
jgi:NADH:ubiquinone oxidoreductase subunit 3 (subunit A)